MSKNIRFKRGNKSNLPSSAPSGTPLWCQDTEELYIGTGTGTSKVGGNSVTEAIVNQKLTNYVPKTQLATINQTGIVKPDNDTTYVKSNGTIYTPQTVGKNGITASTNNLSTTLSITSSNSNLSIINNYSQTLNEAGVISKSYTCQKVVRNNVTIRSNYTETKYTYNNEEFSTFKGAPYSSSPNVYSSATISVPGDEVVFKIRVTTLAENKDLFWADWVNSSSQSGWTGLYLNASGKFIFEAYNCDTDKSSYISNAAVTCSANTTYYIKAKRNGTSVTYSYSTNGTTFSNFGTQSGVSSITFEYYESGGFSSTSNHYPISMYGSYFINSIGETKYLREIVPTWINGSEALDLESLNIKITGATNDGDLLYLTYTTKLSNILTLNTPYVISQITSNAYHCRIWSNKFCEQWGQYAGSGKSGTIALPQAYRDSYYVIVSAEGGSGTSSDTEGIDFTCYFSNLTTTSFRYSSASGRPFSWYTAGYIT